MNYQVQDLLSIAVIPEIGRRKLSQLNPSKFPGYDNWHTGAHRSWRKAVITATYMKGPRIRPGNYRPISLTSVISKIMESSIRDEIVEHMVKHKLLSEDQHKFVLGRDCMTQLLFCLK